RQIERAIAERRSQMLGLGEVDPAEIALGEHHALGVQPTEIVVAEIAADEFAISPIHYAVGDKLASAYSLTAINASVADLRSRASTLITGTCAGNVSALRTSAAGYLGVPSNSLTAIRNGRVRCSKKSTAAKQSCKRRQSTRITAPIAPRTRSSHMNQNRRCPGVPNRYSTKSSARVMRPKSMATVVVFLFGVASRPS